MSENLSSKTKIFNVKAVLKYKHVINLNSSFDKSNHSFCWEKNQGKIFGYVIDKVNQEIIL